MPVSPDEKPKNPEIPENKDTNLINFDNKEEESIFEDEEDQNDTDEKISEEDEDESADVIGETTRRAKQILASRGLPKENQETIMRKKTRETIERKLHSKRLQAAIPNFVLKAIDQAPYLETNHNCSHLFCDQANFTGLSELLTKIYGKEESGNRINELINGAIVASLEVVNKLGGDTVMFGGDAIQVIFTGARHEERAALSGVLMQIHLQKKLDEYLTHDLKQGTKVHEYLMTPPKEAGLDYEKSDKELIETVISKNKAGKTTEEIANIMIVGLLNKHERDSKQMILDAIDTHMRSKQSAVPEKGKTIEEEIPITYEIIDTSKKDQIIAQLSAGQENIEIPKKQITCKIKVIAKYRSEDNTLYRDYVLPLENHAKPVSPKFNCTRIMGKFSFQSETNSFSNAPYGVALKIKRRASVGVHTGTGFLSVTPAHAINKENGIPTRYNFHVTGPGPNEMEIIQSQAAKDTTYVSEETKNRLVTLGCEEYMEFVPRARKGKPGVTDFEVRLKEGTDKILLQKYHTFHRATMENTPFPHELEEKCKNCFEPQVLERILQAKEPVLERFFVSYIKIPHIAELEEEVARGEKSNEELKEAYDTVNNILFRVVTAWGGVINKFNGSIGVIIFWPPKPDDADTAVGCANELYDELKKAGFAAYLGCEQGTNLFGPAGQVTEDTCNDNKRRRWEITCIGNEVNTAARDAATRYAYDKDHVGGVFYSETVRQLVSTESVHPLWVTMKGKSEESVIWQSSVRKKEREHVGELLEYKDEFSEELKKFFTTTGYSRMLVQGAEGGGKSRLVLECEREIAKRNGNGENIFLVKTCCQHKEQNTALAPWFDILRKIYGEELSENKSAGEILEFVKQTLKPKELDYFAPLLLEYLLPEEKRKGIPTISLDATEEKRFLREIVVAFIEQKAKAQSVCVAIDDLHFADEFSLKVIRNLENAKCENPVHLFLATQNGGITPTGKEKNRAAMRMVQFLETGEDPEAKDQPATTTGAATLNFKIPKLPEEALVQLLLQKVRFQSESQNRHEGEKTVFQLSEELPSSVILTLSQTLPENLKKTFAEKREKRKASQSYVTRGDAFTVIEEIKDEAAKEKLIKLINKDYTEPTVLFQAIAGKSNGNPVKADRILFDVLRNSQYIETRFDENGPLHILSDKTLAFTMGSTGLGASSELGVWEQHISPWCDEARLFKNRLEKLNKGFQNIIFLALLMPEGFTASDLKLIADMKRDSFTDNQHPLPDMNFEEISVALMTLSRNPYNFLQKAGKRGGEQIFRITESSAVMSEISGTDKTQIISKGAAEKKAAEKKAAEKAKLGDPKDVADHARSAFGKTMAIMKDASGVIAAYKENRHLAAAFAQERQLDIVGTKADLSSEAFEIIKNIIRFDSATTTKLLLQKQPELAVTAKRIRNFMQKNPNADITELKTLLTKVTEISETLEDSLLSNTQGFTLPLDELETKLEVKAAIPGRIKELKEKVAALAAEIKKTGAEEKRTALESEKKLLDTELAAKSKQLSDLSLEITALIENVIKSFGDPAGKTINDSLVTFLKSDSFSESLTLAQEQIESDKKNFEDLKKLLIESIATHYDEAAQRLQTKKTEAGMKEEELLKIANIEQMAKGYLLKAGQMNIAHPKAIQIYGNALKYVEPNNLIEKFNIKFEMQRSMTRNGLIIDSLDLAKELREIAINLKDEQKQALIANSTSQMMEHRVNEIPYLQEALALAIKVKSGSIILTVLRNIAVAAKMLNSRKLTERATKVFKMLFKKLPEAQQATAEIDATEREKLINLLSLEEIQYIGELIHDCLTRVDLYTEKVRQSTCEQIDTILEQTENSKIELGKLVIQSTMGTSKAQQGKRHQNIIAIALANNLERGKWKQFNTNDETKNEFHHFAEAESKRIFYVEQWIANNDQSFLSLANEQAYIQLAEMEREGDFKRTIFAQLHIAELESFNGNPEAAITRLENAKKILSRTTTYERIQQEIHSDLAFAHYLVGNTKEAENMSLQTPDKNMFASDKCIRGMAISENKTQDANKLLVEAMEELLETANREDMSPQNTFDWIYVRYLKQRLDSLKEKVIRPYIKSELLPIALEISNELVSEKRYEDALVILDYLPRENLTCKDAILYTTALAGVGRPEDAEKLYSQSLKLLTKESAKSGIPVENSKEWQQVLDLKKSLSIKE